MDKPHYYGIITANVRHDPELRPNAKLLYAEITALSDMTGFCWASNEFFMELYGIGDKTVSDLIKQLRDRGYIYTVIRKIDNKNVRLITADKAVYDKIKSAKNGTLDFKSAKNGIFKSAKNGSQNNINNINNNPPLNSPQGERRAVSAPSHLPERFEKLWSFYPADKRGNRKRAIKAWDKLKPSPELVDTIARAMSRQFQAEPWCRGIGIPMVSTYLNNAYWEDAADLTPMVSTAGSNPAEETEDWT